jgi:hypothetical protein
VHSCGGGRELGFRSGGSALAVISSLSYAVA